jgi:DNA-binding NarL/FixJ family response regulator
MQSMVTEHLNFVGGEGVLVVQLPSRAERRLSGLCPSEREVARGLINGKSNAEIAESRGTSRRTIANQVASIFRTFGVRSRAELARCLERSSAPTLQPYAM